MSKWKLTSFEILSGVGLLVLSGGSTSPASVLPVAALGAGGFYLARRSERLGQLVGDTPARFLLVDGEESESAKLALPAKEQQRRKQGRAQEPREPGRFRLGFLNELMGSISSAGYAEGDVQTSALQEVNPEKAEEKVAEAVEKAPKAPKQDADEAWVAEAGASGPAGLEPGKVTSIRQVVDALNRNVDDFPHVFVVGDSGAGKTTLVQLIVGTRSGKVVILDQKRPKGWEGPKWGGLPYVAREKQTASYAPMVRAMAEVVGEMERRYRTQDEASEPFEMLTVVLDEGKNSVEECEELATLYKKIVSIGREVGVRLILISTTDRARKLGFDGEADSMDSFAWVQLGEMALKVRPDLRRRGEGQEKQKVYWAVASFAGGWIPFENERAFKLLPSLNLRRTKAWGKVQYNCQVEAAQPVRKASDVWDELEEVKPGRPAAKDTRAMQAIVLADEAERPVVNGYRYTDADLKLLEMIQQAEMERDAKRQAESPKVSRISADESADERVSVETRTSALSTAVSTRQDATFGVSALLARQAKEAAEVLKTVSDDERSKLRNSLQVWRANGGKKMDAIQRGFECKSGDKYVRGKELFDAAQTIAEYQAARTNK